jgi:hypothetical protein
MAKNDTAVVMHTIGYAGKGSKVKRVTCPKKLDEMMMKMQLNQGTPTFTWRTVGLMGCPKCGRKVRIAYDPSKPVTCMVCMVKALDAIPHMEPVMVKIGKGKNAQKVHSCSASIVIEVPIDGKTKKK